MESLGVPPLRAWTQGEKRKPSKKTEREGLQREGGKIKRVQNRGRHRRIVLWKVIEARES